MIILTYIVRTALVIGLALSVPLMYAMYQDFKTIGKDN